MKRALCIFICIVTLVFFKIDRLSFFELSSSLAQDEIALTFIDDSLLLINLEKDAFLLSLKDNVSSSILKKYHLEDVPIYKISKKPVIENFDISYQDDLDFSFVYSSKKFCVGDFYGCDFTYLYQNDSYIDAHIYFYNDKTDNLLENIGVESYSINPIISILWDEKNYMIVTH